MSSNLLSYFQSAVRALWPAKTTPSPVPPPATAAPVLPVASPAVKPEATQAPPPVAHNEIFFRSLLTAFYHASPHVKTTYDAWLYYSKPDEAKRQQHFDKSLADYEVRRTRQHEERKRERQGISDLAPLRPDELKSLRLSSDQAFPIQARGAKMEFIHQLQAFLRALKVSEGRTQLGEGSGFLRKEFSFTPLPETKEYAALKTEIRSSYHGLKREVEDRADYLLRLMSDILQPPPAVSPVAAAVDQILIPQPANGSSSIAGALLAAEDGNLGAMSPPRLIPDPSPAAQIR